MDGTMENSLSVTYTTPAPITVTNMSAPLVWTQAVLTATPAELTREFSSAIEHHDWLHVGSVVAAFVIGVLVGTYGLILLVR